MLHSEFQKKLGSSIGALQLNLNLTQKQLASKLGISLATYKRVLSGETEKVDFYIIFKLCSLAHVNPMDLVEEKLEPNIDVEIKQNEIIIRLN